MSDISAVRAVERPAQSLVTDPAAYAPPRRAGPPASNRLEPAVTLDLSAGLDADQLVRDVRAEAASLQADLRGQFVRDAQDASRIVYQVVDPSSGDVISQAPTVAAMKALAYAEAAARAQAPARPLDRTA